MERPKKKVEFSIFENLDEAFYFKNKFKGGDETILYTLDEAISKSSKQLTESGEEMRKREEAA